MRGRSYSYSPSPVRRDSGRYRSPSPKGRYEDHRRDSPTSLLVRNLHLDTRSEDLRGPFGEFGPLKDIYLPRDYYTGEPRGFGFVQFVYSEDAEDAKYHMDGQVILGREIIVVFAKENRKKPEDMRARQRPRGVGRRYSRSPRYARSPDYYSPSPRKRGYSRSISPEDREYRERSYSGSSYDSRSRSQSPVRGRSRSRSFNGH